MNSDGTDVLVDDGMSSGMVGEGDNVASALTWKEEQAVRRKMNKTIKNFFKVMPPTYSVMKNPCTKRLAANGWRLRSTLWVCPFGVLVGGTRQRYFAGTNFKP
jgi:hypothetical protein